jgi:hypothetical protein
MGTVASDHNLLFGILALQVNFITRDALIQGMNAWVLHKDRRGGFFQAAGNVALLQKDSDLDPLRDRDDFQAFLAEVLPARKPGP